MTNVPHTERKEMQTYHKSSLSLAVILMVQSTFCDRYLSYLGDNGS